LRPCALRFERRMIRRLRSIDIALWISTFRSVSFETPIRTNCPPVREIDETAQ
jgi:hypothetical protein